MLSEKGSQTLLVTIDVHKWRIFLERLWDNCIKSKSIYFGRTRTDFISLSHSRLLAMTDARSCLERPVSFSSWSINVVAGRPQTRPLERLPCFGSQIKILKSAQCWGGRRNWPCTACIFLTITRHLSGPFEASHIQSLIQIGWWIWTDDVKYVRYSF